MRRLPILPARSISVSYEAIRLWVNKFGPVFFKHLRLSNRFRRRNNSWKVTLPSTVCSIFTGIRYQDDSSNYFGFGLSQPGM